MDQKDKRLFSDRNIAFLATVMPNGSPQVSPVWADYKNERIRINTAEGRVKHKNILRDPRVAVSVVSQNDPLDMMMVRGTVEEIIPDYEYKHIDQLTQKYMGLERYPFRQKGEKRIILAIKPDSVFVMPKLKPSD